MPSIERALAGEVLEYRLGTGADELIDAARLERDGRGARTLVKDGALRVTLVAVAPGGHVAPHRAAGPITVHALAGEIDLQVGERTHHLEAGDLAALGAGVEHSVSSRGGGRFLLTVAEPVAEGRAAGSGAQA